MTKDRMVYRSFYVDPDVDDRLKEQAAQLGLSKGEMCRRYLHLGIAAMQANGELAELPRTEPRLRVRGAYFLADVDSLLRSQVFELRTSMNNLIRRYLRTGMVVMQAPSQDQPKGKRRKRSDAQ